MVRIPSEYQEVEYVESTGTQWIDSGLQFGESDFKITSRFAQTQRTAGEQPLISIWSSTYQYWNCFIRDANRAVDFYLGGHVVPQSPVLSVNEIINIALERNGSEWTITQPGSTLSKTYNPSRVNDTSMKIFKRGDINGTAYARMYSLTVEMDGELAANFIPCYHKSSGEIGMYDTVSKQFYTNSGTGTFLKGNDVTYDNINLLESRRRILLNIPHIETVSDTIASFKTDVATKLKECKIHFTPIQEGEGDPSPDNVRPINGWDGVTVNACGKNLIDESFLRNADNYHIAGPYAYMYTDWIYLTPNTQYKFSWSNYDNNAIDSCYLAVEQRYIVNGNYKYNTNITTLTTDSTGRIRFGLNKQGYATYQEALNDIFDNGSLQLELGSEPTDYEPYNATSITIPFPQTIYGGYVDLIKGDVVETYSIANEFSQYRQNNGFIAYRTAIDSINKNNFYCNMIGKMGSFNSSNMNQNIIQTGRVGGNLYFALDENADINSLQLVYPRNTPITHSIDPQTLKALRGMNNIWSDANGNVEVSFYTH